MLEMLEQQVEQQQQLQQQQQAALVRSHQAALLSPIDEEFNKQCLQAHNAYRQLHDCPPLKLSAGLAASAQIWADHLATIGYLTHSSNAAGNYGENVAMKMALRSRDYTGSQATAQWYSEIEMYNFEGVENQSRCGHFSQVIWKSTRKAGFGKAVSPDGKMFAVGHYSPPGNMMDAWVINIPAPISGQIKIPSYQEIMGADEQQRSAVKIVSSTKSLVEDPEASNPAAALLLSASRELGDISRLEPRPREPLDRQIGKSTKTRVLNGDRSLVLTATFMRPDGSRYQLTNQVPLRDPGQTTSQPSNRDKQSSGSLLPGNPPTGAISDKDRIDDFSPRRFADEMLAAHNELRVRHRAPRLVRSESLESLAQNWAARLADEGQLRQCDSQEAGDLGQSLASLPARCRLGEMKRLSTALNLGPAALLAKQWYSERTGFKLVDGDEAEAGCCINGGHFTQMVWRSTEKLGVGCTIDKTTGDAYAVCFYYPSGNVAGQFADNVFFG